jgi:hypothetical protein
MYFFLFINITFYAKRQIYRKLSTDQQISVIAEVRIENDAHDAAKTQ